MASLVQLKGDTLARFEKINPVLRIKEPALIALDPANPTKYTHMVIGDGKSKFKDLPMLNMGVSQDYEKMENLPSIENVEIIGNITLEQLGAVYQEDFDKRLPLVIDTLASDYREKVLVALDSINKGVPVPIFLKVSGLTLYVCGWRMMEDGTMLWITAPLAVKEDAFVELGITAYSVNTTDGSIVALDQMLTKVLGESALAQEIGTNPNKVISQKVITEILEQVSETVDKRIEKLPIELTIEGNDYIVTTPLETLSEYAAKFYADPSAYAWQITFVVGSDKLGVIPIFLISYGGIHIGFYNPDMSGTMKLLQIMLDGTTATSAVVSDWARTLVEVVQTTGSDTEQVMSQDAVTKALKTQVEVALAAAKQYTDDSVSTHNTSETAHADIRELLNSCIGLPVYDDKEYTLTFATINGSRLVVDFPIEQLALRYNEDTQSIEFDNHDGTTTSIPVSAFVKVYIGSIGDQIQISIDNQNAIHATLLKNSVSWDHLSVELQQRVNDHITTTDFAEKTIRTDIEQSLSEVAQRQALKNLGLNIYVTDSTILGTIISPEVFDQISQSSGVMLTDISKLFVNSGIDGIFVTYANNELIGMFTVDSSTREVSQLGVISFSDPNALKVTPDQGLSRERMTEAFKNLGWKVYVTGSNILGTSVSDEVIAALGECTAILFSDTGELYNRGSDISSTYNFWRVRSNSGISRIVVFTEEKRISTVGASNFSDVQAVKFVDQTLTDVQRMKVFENLGWDVYVTESSLLGSSNISDAVIEKISASHAILFSDTGQLLMRGFASVDNTYFYTIYRASEILYCALSVTNKSFSTLVQTNITDKDSVHFSHPQTLTSEQQNRALANIGLNLVCIDASLLGTTLSDTVFNSLVGSNGFILLNNGTDAAVFVKGATTADSISFTSGLTSSKGQSVMLTLATKTLSMPATVSYNNGSVLYQSQTLTDAQKSQAFNNLSWGVHVVPASALGSDDEVSEYEKGQRLSAKAILLSGDGTLYTFGSQDATYRYYFQFFCATSIYGIRVEVATGKIKAPIRFNYNDVNAVRFASVQNLTAAEKQIARTNIDATRGQTIQNVAETAVTMDIVGGTTYLCGELASLTVNSIEDSTDEAWIYFTSGATATVVTWPVGTKFEGFSEILPNAEYEICIRKSRVIIAYVE